MCDDHSDVSILPLHFLSSYANLHLNLESLHLTLQGFNTLASQNSALSIYIDLHRSKVHAILGKLLATWGLS